jgi:hypothetical protein
MEHTMERARAVVAAPGADRTDRTIGDCDYTSSLAITIWPDRYASAKEDKTVTWPELCKRIPLEPDRAEKSRCRLLKLARFGDRRTDKGSLRHDANVIAVTGIEGDHDTGTMTPEAAIAILERHQVRAMVYTSWSHTTEAPRWRVLAPLSRPVPPAERLAYAEALNGILEGSLAPESGTLSQSYYIGWPAGAERKVLVTFDDPDEGYCLDEIDVWQQYRRPCGAPAPADTSEPTAERKTQDDYLAELLTGDDVHGAGLRIVGRMVRDGLSDATIRTVFGGLALAVRETRGADRAADLTGSELTRMIAGARARGYAPSREPDAWPDLVPFGRADLPRLRPDLLPSWAGSYAAAVAASTETPPELAAGLILAAAAVPCARRLSVMVAPGHIEPTCLWVAVALPPGNRKSAVQSAVCAPLIDWERQAAEIAAPEIAAAESEAKTLQARANAARAAAAKAKNSLDVETSTHEAADLEARIEPPPVAPQLWTSDATPERLGAMLADQNECMAWLSAEAGLFDLLAGRYSRGIPNLDLVLKAWSGDPERVDRGSRPPVYLRHPRLSIGLSPQPDVLRGLSMQPGFRGRGLLGRFSYLMPPSPLGYRHLGADRHGARVPPAVETAYRDGIAAMLEWPSSGDCGVFGGNEGDPGKPHLLRLEPAAYQDWLAFARAVEARMRPGADLEGLTDLAGKTPGTAARIAAVMHGIEHAHGRPWEAPVSPDTIARALEMAAVMLEHGKAVMDMMGADPAVAAARRVWDWIERGRRTDATMRTAWQALKGQFSRMADLTVAVEVLVERGYVRIGETERTGPGRPPSPLIEVRPDIAESWS